MSSPTTASANEEDPPSRKISLTSSDNKILLVDEKVANQMVVVKTLIEDCPGGDDITLTEVRGETLAKVIEYCQKQVEENRKVVENEEEQRELQAWKEEYTNVDADSLYYLFTAASYLDVKGLVKLCAQAVVDKFIRGKQLEEIRDALNIPNDFGPGEEEEIINKDRWAFEGH